MQMVLVLPGSENQGVDNSGALFAQGAFALWGNASQEAGVFTDQFPCSFDWGVAELPTLTGEVKRRAELLTERRICHAKFL